jgi:type I restriction enzyme M protein
MIWVAPSEKDTVTETLEKHLWDAADQFRANTGLKAQEYSAPVLGLIFLRFAEVRFAAQRARLEKAEELETLNGQARELEAAIAKNAAEILET